jgi:hypothetical protein
MKFPIFLHLSIFALLASLSTAAHCDDVATPPPRMSECPIPAQLKLSVDPSCNTLVCAQERIKMLKEYVECIKKQMQELQIAAGSAK